MNWHGNFANTYTRESPVDCPVSEIDMLDDLKSLAVGATIIGSSLTVFYLVWTFNWALWTLAIVLTILACWSLGEEIRY